MAPSGQRVRPFGMRTGSGHPGRLAKSDADLPSPDPVPFRLVETDETDQNRCLVRLGCAGGAVHRARVGLIQRLLPRDAGHATGTASRALFGHFSRTTFLGPLSSDYRVVLPLTDRTVLLSMV